MMRSRLVSFPSSWAACSRSCSSLSAACRAAPQSSIARAVAARPTAMRLCSSSASKTPAASGGGWSYVAFAKANPIANNLMIATLKTAAADLLVQSAIERKSVSEIDWKRTSVFALFGFVYLGAFQYLYQVNVFTRLFPGVERFTSQSWAAKATDMPGLLALAGQCVLDVGMLCYVYLPTFYVFKAGVFAEDWDVKEWFKNGIVSWNTNWEKDSYDTCRVWFPADLVCFSVPLYLRLPIRHIVSFVWTAYISFMRGKK